MVIQSFFMSKNIVKGNVIPINEEREQYILIFGTNSNGELIFKVDADKNIFFRNHQEWQLLKR